jgi:protein-disulfide isomerase/uncharacterized membrane protein
MSKKSVIIPFVLALASAVAAILTRGGESPCTPLALGVAAMLLLCVSAKAWHRWGGMLLTSWSGFSVAMYLIIEKKGLAESFCSVSAVCDCGTVNASEHSMLFGIPIAAFGAAFYAGVTALSVMVIASGDRAQSRYGRAAQLIGLGALFSVLYSIFLAMVSMELGKWCMLCVSLYGINLILLVNALALAKSTDDGLFRGGLSALWTKSDKSGSVMSGVGIVVLLATVFWYGSAPGDAAPKAESAADLSKLFVAPEGVLELDGTEPIFGSPSAPYRVVEFADFECPACGAAFDPVHDLVAASPDVQLSFKHYPISGICNDAIDGDRHLNSCDAAVAADCAGEQGKFWEMASSLFKNQRHLNPDAYDILAKQQYLDLDVFSACRARVSADVGVRSDVSAAATVGVHATPSLYLKGIQGDEWVLVRGGVASLQALLDAHRSGKTMPPTPKAEPHSH